VRRATAWGEPCGPLTVVSHPNRLMPQHITLYRSAAEKRTIERRDSTPRHQLPLWRGVITSNCQRLYQHRGSTHMHAVHALGRYRRKSALRLRLRRGKRNLESFGKPVVNFYQTTLAASIVVQRPEGQ
jgi:hypothetical protein